MQNSLALAMIVAPRDEEAVGLERCLESVHAYVDAIYITITGENQKVEEVAKKYNAEISHFDWVDDFSAARNFNFRQVYEDWILWLDADDTLVGGENIKKYIDGADSLRADGFAFLYKYNFDANGNCIDEHWKVQLLRNDKHFTWKGRIHEDPLMIRVANWKRVNDITRVHHSNNERGAQSHARNLRILYKQYEDENGTDPRTVFYLGRTLAADGQNEKAIEFLEKYLDLSGWDEERYEAHLLMGQCFLALGDIDTAIRVYSAATIEREDYPDAYILKAMAYIRMGAYDKALANLKTAYTKDIPSQNTYFNPMLYAREMPGARALCELHLGKFTDAIQHVNMALKADPRSEHLVELKKTIIGCWKNLDISKKYVDIIQFLEETSETNKVLPLLSSVPTRIADNPIILSAKYNYLKPAVWPHRSVAFYCGASAESWVPSDQNGKGIGGSETAVIELSKRLVKLGWDVTVFNNCNLSPDGEVFDGVTYRNYWQFNWQDTFDVLISWRRPELFDLEIQARLKVLDLHDVMNPLDFTEKRLERIDKIFVKSQYHRSLFPSISDSKFIIIGNGIDLTRFSENVEKKPRRFIYSSSPNRGLDIILQYFWPTIKQKFPDAELHVFYGWNTFYELEKNNPERMAWMRRIQQLMKQDGVFDHGRVGQNDLAREMLASSFWLYPTYFPEIHCITACEMQAAGVYPITSGYAALEETQITGVKLEGDVFDPEWQKQYLDTVLEVAEKPVDSEQIKKVAEQFDWDIVASAWSNELT